MLLEVGVDEPLQRALAERRRRAARSAGTRPQPSASRQLVRRDLALVEPVGEVPQRALAAVGLVDGRAPSRRRRTTSTRNVRVRAPRHAALDRRRRRRVEQRPASVQACGHAWPSGSIGPPHSGHGGRPPATSSAGPVDEAGDLRARSRNRGRGRDVDGTPSSSSSSSSSAAPRPRGRCGRRPRPKPPPSVPTTHSAHDRLDEVEQGRDGAPSTVGRSASSPAR